jgi:hypothetical protein
MNHEDPHQIAAATVEAISHRQYHAVVALLLTLAVWMARAYASRIPGKLGAFLSSGQAGVVLSVVGGQLGAIATALVAGKPMSLDLVLSGLVVSATAGGIFSGAKALKSQPIPEAPPAAPGAPSLRALLPLVALLGLSLAACGDGGNAKLKALAGSASTVTSGWRVYNKVDAQRQPAIRALARTDARAADVAMNKHVAARGILDASLSAVMDLIERIDREGFTAALVVPLAKATADVALAVKAYQEVQ